MRTGIAMTYPLNECVDYADTIGQELKNVTLLSELWNIERGNIADAIIAEMRSVVADEGGHNIYDEKVSEDIFNGWLHAHIKYHTKSGKRVTMTSATRVGG